MTAFIKALLFVVVAEMGDKTQLLAMAMASKYKAKQVLIGVFVATVCNHALAVAVGNYLSAIIPMNTVKIVAGISFLVFGLWTLRGDKIDDENEKKSKFGPIVTVAIAFFLAEMGDKTQLMTIAIAADYHEPFMVLMGTTTGMMVADGIGIICGAWMCKHIPEVYIKWGAGIIFMFFGTLALYNSIPTWMISAVYIVPYLLITAISIYVVGFKLSYHDKVSDITLPKNNEGENNNSVEINK